MATKHFGKGTLVQPIRDTREHTTQGPLCPGSQALRPLSSPAPVRGGDGQGKGQGLREERLMGCGRWELLLHSLGHRHSNPKRGARASPQGPSLLAVAGLLSGKWEGGRCSLSRSAMLSPQPGSAPHQPLREQCRKAER